MGKVYKFWIGLLAVIGGCSLIYFIFIFLMLGPASAFNYVWLLLALLCSGLILLICKYAGNGKIPPKWVVIPVELIVGAGFLLFIVIEAIIIHNGKGKPEENADYLLVLGAKVNGTQPSLILKYRIDAAVEYLKQNPDTMVIASGGKGTDERISEAQCIYNELVAQGIAPDRIIMEESSTSTKENLIFASEFFEVDTQSVVITTTDFHIFRAVQLAKACGYQKVSANPAKSVWWLIPTNYTREFLAVLKDYIAGNL